MEQKYYTPAPEDLRIGFECQVQVDFGCWEYAKLNANSNVFDLVPSLIEDRSLRVPHLTAEQIEAEGWKYTHEGTTARMYRKRLYTLYYDRSADGWANISKDSDEEGTESFSIYAGKCRCINDLRLICKLLGI